MAKAEQIYDSVRVQVMGRKPIYRSASIEKGNHKLFPSMSHCEENKGEASFEYESPYYCAVKVYSECEIGVLSQQ